MKNMTDNSSAQPRLSISTWSLHRSLGQPQLYGVESGQHIPSATHGRGTLSLLEVPARLAEFGIHTLEICHFHLPSIERAYLAELRGALEDAHIELFSLLIDAGDITDPVYGMRDLEWIGSWFAVASQLGATCARAIAGKSDPSDENIGLSVARLSMLAKQAQDHGLHLMTENWFGLLSTPSAVTTVLDRLEGNVGLCFDFGNWKGPEKYADLEAIAPYAESCHTKAHFLSAQELDRDDYVCCLDITRKAGFSGPYTLIYDGPNTNEWQGLAQEREIVAPYLQKA